jgi:hypothetical protein
MGGSGDGAYPATSEARSGDGNDAFFESVRHDVGGGGALAQLETSVA